jgi:hypothetical protein
MEVGARTPVGRGKLNPEKAQLAHPAEHRSGNLAGLLPTVDARDDLVLDPGPHGFSEQLVLVPEDPAHRAPLRARAEVLSSSLL